MEIPLTQGFTALVDPEDADLAQFRWYAQVRRHRHGTVYAIRRATRELLHRVILERKLGHSLSQAMFTDHVNGNGLDNRRENLRPATQSQNLANSRMHLTHGKRPKSSKYRGVCWARDKGKWIANISKDGRVVHIGHFEDETEAARAFDQAARELHGEFAVLNGI